MCKALSTGPGPQCRVAVSYCEYRVQCSHNCCQSFLGTMAGKVSVSGAIPVLLTQQQDDDSPQFQPVGDLGLGEKLGYEVFGWVC